MQRKSKRPTKAYWRALDGLYGTSGNFPAPKTEEKRRPSRTLDCPTEQEEQFKVVWWMKKEGIPHHHSPNGGYRDVREGAKFKRLGVSAGFPDIFIPKARKGRHGLYIELKRQLGGKLSESQIVWRDLLLLEGYAWFEAKGYDECIKIIQEYLG